MPLICPLRTIYVLIFLVQPLDLPAMPRGDAPIALSSHALLQHERASAPLSSLTPQGLVRDNSFYERFIEADQRHLPRGRKYSFLHRYTKAQRGNADPASHLPPISQRSAPQPAPMRPRPLTHTTKWNAKHATLFPPIKSIPQDPASSEASRTDSVEACDKEIWRDISPETVTSRNASLWHSSSTVSSCVSICLGSLPFPLLPRCH